MRQSLAFLCSFGATFGASAADLPARAPAPPPASPISAEPATRWTGFYAGLHAGANAGDAKLAPLPAGDPSSIRFAGVSGGGLAGYNHMLGNALLGVEGDIGASRARGSTIFPGLPAAALEQRTGGLQARARLRAGYRIGNAMIFGAAGFTAQHEQFSLSSLAPAPVESRSLGSTRAGWNIGFGVDYAIAPNWISRAEYIHDHFGSRTAAFATIPGSAIASRKIDSSAHTLRLAIIYKFGDPVRRDAPAAISVLY